MKLISVEKSTRAGKKWCATFKDDKTGHYKRTHFGALGANDYTITGSDEARERYWKRHKKDLSTGDPTRAGFLSLYLLWNKATLEKSIKDYKRRFGL